MLHPSASKIPRRALQAGKPLGPPCVNDRTAIIDDQPGGQPVRLHLRQRLAFDLRIACGVLILGAQVNAVEGQFLSLIHI